MAEGIAVKSAQHLYDCWVGSKDLFKGTGGMCREASGAGRLVN
jgi:hypothetical protein